MQKIEKKVWPEYFEEIIKNKKTFELRLNDFDINEGDILFLKEYRVQMDHVFALARKKYECTLVSTVGSGMMIQ